MSCGPMSARRAKYQELAVYTGMWDTGMCEAPCSDPLYCCFAVLCPHAASYMARIRALHNDMNNYECCGGFLPFCRGKLHEKDCPYTCLCCEVFVCFPSSVMNTRYLLQQEMRVGNSSCDDALIALVQACECLACIVSCFGPALGVPQEAADVIHTCADNIYCSVCACMQTQHHVQMVSRDAGRRPVVAAQPPQQQMMQMPPPQQQMQMQQQQPVYGAPPQQQMGYAPPQQGYPQQGYAPQQGQYNQQQQYGQQQPQYYPPPPGYK